jgi:type IV pilus assembly protein PilW
MKKHLIDTRRSRRSRSRGLTLIEILVGMVVALITTLAIFQVTAVSESYRRTTTGGSDALQNGAYAQFMLERYIRLGASNFATLPKVFGCPLRVYKGGAAVVGPISAAAGYPEPFKSNIDFPVVLSPVIIRPGSNSDPDTVLVLAGQHQSIAKTLTPTGIPKDMVTFAASVGINNLKDSSGNVLHDLLLAVDQDPGAGSSTCDVAEAMDTSVALTGSGNVYTSSDAFNNYSKNTVIANLGNRPLFVAFTVGNDGQTANALLSYNVLTNTLTSSADGILTIKAIYGVASLPTSLAVTSWQAPTGSYSPGSLSADTVSLLRAVRIAVVARNAQPDKQLVSNATIDVFADTSAKQTITVPDRHYRYKVFETIVPLREMISASYSQ